VARRDGGADGEVGRDVVGRREGEGRARRSPDGNGGWPDRIGRVCARPGGVQDGGGGEVQRGGVVPRGGVPDGMGWSAGWGFVGAGWDGRVSEREGRRGPQERVSEQKGRVKLAAWIMCVCGMLGPLVLHPVPHHWNRLC
jgi:hypothetical protein